VGVRIALFRRMERLSGPVTGTRLPLPHGRIINETFEFVRIRDDHCQASPMEIGRPEASVISGRWILALRLTSKSSPGPPSGRTTRLCTSATLGKNGVWIGHFRLGRFSALASAETGYHTHRQDDRQPNFFSAHSKAVA
jgi:hypothetical protein